MADKKHAPEEEIIEKENLEQEKAAAEASVESESEVKEDSAETEKKKSKKHAAKTYTQKEMDVAVEELLKVQKQRDEYLDMAQRQRAEFDNFRKRSETQRLEANGNGARDTIAAILPVVDNMQRAIKQCENVADDDPLKQGIMMVFNQLYETLKSLGLEKIEALGEAFDHNLHHAVVEGEASDEYPAGTVMEVLQDGYKVKEKIIRYAMVKVAK
ncbi:MAG: nucleotide exchange factor GrpE [Clostridia bacterium]|nr:nucleotide exchange factor GrpE [Clostridia bacterium]